MTDKRIIPCLDIRDGRVVKGVRFIDIKNVGDPVELADYYVKSGADELAFYDINASIEARGIFADLLKAVAKVVPVPLTAGGGVENISDFEKVLECGADKVSVNTGAIRNKSLISDAARRFGSEYIIMSMDVKQVDGFYHVFVKGGAEDTGLDALQWAVRCQEEGAGEILVNSIDADGVKNGFDLPLMQAVADKVNIPITASGGAGTMRHFAELFAIPGISSGLAASVFHYRDIEINKLKDYLNKQGIPVKL